MHDNSQSLNTDSKAVIFEDKLPQMGLEPTTHSNQISYMYMYIHVNFHTVYSSQGWAPKCPIHSVFACLYYSGVVFWFSN